MPACRTQPGLPRAAERACLGAPKCRSKQNWPRIARVIMPGLKGCPISRRTDRSCHTVESSPSSVLAMLVCRLPSPSPREARPLSASTSTRRASTSSNQDLTAPARSGRGPRPSGPAADFRSRARCRRRFLHRHRTQHPFDISRRPDLSALLLASRSVGEPQAWRCGGVTSPLFTPARQKRTASRCSNRPPGLSPGVISPLAIPQNGSILATRRIVSKKSRRWSPGRRSNARHHRCVYGRWLAAGLARAPSIKVAEAAKVIENSQRDLNIAFMNELSAISPLA